MRNRLWLAIVLSLIILITVGCAVPVKGSSTFKEQFNSIVQPYSFDFATWEAHSLFEQITQRIMSPHPASVLNSQSVVHYFSYVALMNTLKSDIQMLQAKKVQGDVKIYEDKLKETQDQITALKPIVEQTIAKQVTLTLADLGIVNPLGNNWFNLPFPPVNFKLEKPLYELIISPRDKIQRSQSITIKPDISGPQIEEVESSVDRLNVSALVVQIGGLGATYPSFVTDNADLRFTIDTAAHEWLHQYLVFKPLGLRYALDLLGISKNYEIDTINETVASIFGREVGALIYDRYYNQYKNPAENVVRPPVSPDFDFNGTMRGIRRTVDDYLAIGQVDTAEKYMAQMQQLLASKGYYIRKLNQAYFAFYGTYADGPTSVDPIGEHIRLLRKHSASIKDFIAAASALSSSGDLVQKVAQYK
jgi:hypothetical protein